MSKSGGSLGQEAVVTATPESKTACDADMVARLLRERRTISQALLSSELEPDHSKVIDAIESARWAPNHHLTEPWHFYVLDPNRIKRLGEMWAECLERKSSPASKVAAKRRQWGESKGVVILTCTHAPQANETMRRENYAACCCAAQNFMLHLWSEGIGTKWSTGAVWEHEEFWALIGFASQPKHTDVVGLFFYGVPERIPERHRKRMLADIVVNFRAATKNEM